MKNSVIIWIVSNYLLSVAIFFTSLIQSWQLKQFIYFLVIALFLWNMGFFLLRQFLKVVTSPKDTSTFEMNVDISEDEARELLRETKSMEVSDEE